MEIRVHGIGGTTAQSMLGLEADASLVPLWPPGPGATPYLWTGDDPEVAAYHWAPLTSGSRWFILWPLLLPFTLLNVAGFMHPAGAAGRVAKLLHGVLCYVATVWFASWLVLGGQVLATRNELLGVAGAVGVGLVLVGATCVGNARQRSGRPSRPSRVGGRGLSDPGFFTTGTLLWSIHVAAMAATFAGILVFRPTGEGGLRRQAVDVVNAAGALLVVLLVVLALLAVVSYLTARQSERGPAAWAFRTVGAAGLGAAMIGGLFIALLRVLVEDDTTLRGPAFIVFDVYGWGVLAAVAVGATVAVVLLVRKSPGELVPEVGSRLLPNPESWFRARVALLPRAGIAALGAAALSFLAVGSWTFVDRAPATVARWVERVGLDWSVSAAERAREAGWYAADTPPVRIAQATIYWLFGFMFLNLVRSKGSLAALRRVGSVWDILTFWPRRFHPFAVRPYPVHALPQLCGLLAAAGDDQGDPSRSEPHTVLAHSQGSMLVAAALAPLGADGTTARVEHLVTVGCPMRSLYMKAFPAYCHEDLIADVSRSLVSPKGWSNVFRFTDHVGRTVFGEETGWSPTSQSPPAGPARIWRRETSPGAGRRHADCAVADPRGRQHPISGHNDYWEDERVREVVAGA